jgi:ketosteroid isomerase-like protein
MHTISCSLADAYVRAVNDADPAALLDLFAADAVVNDAGREFRGHEAIGAWSASDIFAANVRLKVTDSAVDQGEALLTAIVDGDFDRTGLPDPVVIVHRVAAENDKIVQLTCRLAE